MIHVIADLLPLAVVVMISPVNIIAAILLLFSPRPLPAAGAYLLGFMAGLAVVLVALDLVAEKVDWSDTGPEWFGAVLRIVLGVGLLVVAIGKFRIARRAEVPELPAWMNGVTELAPRRALTTGFLIGAGNPKNVAMAIAAAVVIGTAALPTGQIVVVVLGYVVLASLGVAAPLVVAVVAGERSTAILTEARAWLERHSATVLGVMYLVFAVVLVTKGVQAIP